MASHSIRHGIMLKVGVLGVGVCPPGEGEGGGLPARGGGVCLGGGLPARPPVNKITDT